MSTADFAQCGLLVGHATDLDGVTGLTVIRGDSSPFRAAGLRLGGATSTRQMDALDPMHVVSRIDAVVFTGGSAFGLDSASGAMRWFEERGRGFSVGSIVVPVVPTAALFDLGPLGSFRKRPTAEMAYMACESATGTFAEGSVGAGTGATVGKFAGIEHCMKGGVGGGSATVAGVTASAIAVVNAYGSVYDARGRVIAGARNGSNGFLDPRVVAERGEVRSRFRGGDSAAGNTTLAFVALSTPFSREELLLIARGACAALYRRIRPVAGQVDGDVVIAASPLAGESGSFAAAEAAATAALEEGIERSVTRASGVGGIPASSDLLSG